MSVCVLFNNLQSNIQTGQRGGERKLVRLQRHCKTREQFGLVPHHITDYGKAEDIDSLSASHGLLSGGKDHHLIFSILYPYYTDQSIFLADIYFCAQI